MWWNWLHYELNKVDTSDMIADFLTKTVSSKDHAGAIIRAKITLPWLISTDSSEVGESVRDWAISKIWRIATDLTLRVILQFTQIMNNGNNKLGCEITRLKLKRICKF